MKRWSPDAEEESYQLKPHPAERVLLAQAEPAAADRVLCTTLGRGQWALDYAKANPNSALTIWEIDRYIADETLDSVRAARNIGISSLPDPPDAEYDMVVVPVCREGEAELTRDQLQHAFHRLKIGGVMWSAVNHQQDTWLLKELEKLDKHIKRKESRFGTTYRVVKSAPLKKLRNFQCEFAFRDEGRLVKAVSRPGVFSHRHLDLGARALLETMQIKSGDKVLDIGCGSGAVGLAAALRAPKVSVLGIDSNCRAAMSMLAGAEANGLTTVTAEVDTDGHINEPGTFDLVLGNPPYYSRYKISEIFLQAAKKALKPNGRVMMVTKRAEWFEARMKQLFREVTIHEARGYLVVEAKQGKANGG